MKLRNVPLFFALTAFLFSGCEGAQVPLADPDQPIDSSLIGTWDIIDLPEGDDATHMKVIAFNEHEYYVEMWDAYSGVPGHPIRSNAATQSGRTRPPDRSEARVLVLHGRVAGFDFRS